MNLDDARIAAMRHQIMTEVTHDQRSRTKRLRSGVAAFMGVLVLGGVGIATLPNLASNDSGDFVAGPDVGESAEPEPPASAEDPILGDRDRQDLGSRDPLLEREPADDPGEETSTSPSVVSRVTVTIQADDPVAAAREAADRVVGFDGVVDEHLESSIDTDNPQTFLSVRVPHTNLADALGNLEDLGEVRSTDRANADVAVDIEDLDTQIGELQSSVDRLSALLDEAETTSERLDAEERLTERQAELDGLLGQRDQLIGGAAMSEITVTFVGGDDSTGWFLKALPWTGLLLLAVFVAWLFMRRGGSSDGPVETERAPATQWA